MGRIRKQVQMLTPQAQQLQSRSHIVELNAPAAAVQPVFDSSRRASAVIVAQTRGIFQPRRVPRTPLQPFAYRTRQDNAPYMAAITS